MNKKPPQGWFDLSQQQFADLGAMFYLAALTEAHHGRTLAQVLSVFEPALRTSQYRIYRSGGHPRAFVTFAGLAPQAERRYAVDGKSLRPDDWASGSSFWVIDLIAPFGQAPQIVTHIKNDMPHDRVRTNRIVGDLKTPRIVEWRRDASGQIGLKFYRIPEFSDVLGREPN